MANPLLAYRVALEMQQRRRGRGGREPAYRLADVSERLLRCVVRAHATGHADLTSLDDYQLAICARVSQLQTRELYEEIGLGILVREALDWLGEQHLVSISHKAPSGPYRGVAPTESGLGAVNVDPWYRRILMFFDP